MGLDKVSSYSFKLRCGALCPGVLQTHGIDLVMGNLGDRFKGEVLGEPVGGGLAQRKAK